MTPRDPEMVKRVEHLLDMAVAVPTAKVDIFVHVGDQVFAGIDWEVLLDDWCRQGHLNDEDVSWGHEVVRSPACQPHHTYTVERQELFTTRAILNVYVFEAP